jgi:hypothetical protein
LWFAGLCGEGKTSFAIFSVRICLQNIFLVMSGALAPCLLDLDSALHESVIDK